MVNRRHRVFVLRVAPRCSESERARFLLAIATRYLIRLGWVFPHRDSQPLFFSESNEISNYRIIFLLSLRYLFIEINQLGSDLAPPISVGYRNVIEGKVFRDIAVYCIENQSAGQSPTHIGWR